MTRRFRVPTASFEVEAEDGPRIRGSRLGTAPDSIVLCHGFLGWHRKGRMVRFAESLARRFSVYAFDFRGHGRSEGLCTFGDREVLDIEAVVTLAREEAGAGRVVTVGGSMGGIAAVRHGGLYRDVDCVVAISTPAGWDGHPSDAVRKMSDLTGTERGRRLARMLGVRVTQGWESPSSPEELAPRISPAPLLVVHGRDDHFFDDEQAWRLYRAAGEPKRLLLAERFGHAEDGYTPAFAELLATRIREAIGPAPPG
jgi:pimeloyl-ACP methyl ester carboxylesterase